MNNNFNDLNLNDKLTRAIKKMKFTKMTPIQMKAFEPLMGKRNLLAMAPTGTGKTCAFGVPLLEMIDPGSKAVQSLIICPTRELAKQVSDVLRDLTTYMHGIKVMTIYGGERIDHQIKRLKGKPQIIVATPGRIIDHLSRRTVKLSDLKMVVLDEADRMLDMGFRNDIKKILDAVPEERQMVMFSATMPEEIKKISKQYLKNEVFIEVKGKSRVVDTIEQFSIEVMSRQKNQALMDLLKTKDFKSAIVFVRTKSRARQLSKRLTNKGFESLALHGDLSQNQRDHVMRKYKKAGIPILVATDVASRGIDVKAIDAVINFDIPEDSESYVHRIGRTGRAEEKGTAYTFIDPSERKKLRDIGKNTNSAINNFMLEEGASPIEETVSNEPRRRRYNSKNKKRRPKQEHRCN